MINFYTHGWYPNPPPLPRSSNVHSRTHRRSLTIFICISWLTPWQKSSSSEDTEIQDMGGVLTDRSRLLLRTSPRPRFHFAFLSSVPSFSPPSRSLPRPSPARWGGRYRSRSRSSGLLSPSRGPLSPEHLCRLFPSRPGLLLEVAVYKLL